MRRLLVLCILGCQPQPVASPDDERVARDAVRAALSRLDTMRLTRPYPTSLAAIGITLDSLTTGRLELHDSDGRIVVTRGATTCTASQSYGEVRCGTE